MTLTLGGGPLSPRAPETVNYRVDGPAHKLLFHPFPRRIRGVLGGRTVVDSDRAMLLHETAILPQLYVPIEDLDADLLVAADHQTHCPFKGDAAYHSVKVGETVAENAVWSYPEPVDTADWLRGYAAVYWSAMDSWWDEDEEVFGHIRDPYHRVDARASSRHVRVLAGDQVLAETDHPVLVSETGLPNQFYLRPADVRQELLHPVEKKSVCPYKGEASYLATADGTEVAWTYAEPVADATALTGLICFDSGAVKVEVGETTIR